MGCSLSLSFHFEHEKYICENHFIRIVFRGQKFEKWVLMLIKLPLKRCLAKAVIKSTIFFFQCKHITQFKCMIPYIIYLIYISKKSFHLFYIKCATVLVFVCICQRVKKCVCVCVILMKLNVTKFHPLNTSIKYEREKENEKRENITSTFINLITLLEFSFQAINKIRRSPKNRIVFVKLLAAKPPPLYIKSM